MTYKAPLKKSRIKFEGLFDIEGLYKFMRDWLSTRHFIFTESKYKHKLPSPLGAEIELEWSAWRKETEFVRYWIIINFHFWDMTEVEVIREGKKVKRNKARFEIVFGGDLEMDYQGRFEKTPFLKTLEQFYYKFIFTQNKEMGMYWDELYYLVYRLQTEVKKFLGMEASESAY